MICSTKFLGAAPYQAGAHFEQWRDVDFEDLLVPVRRSVVMMVEGVPKTEASAKDLPLDAALAESHLKLKFRSPYQQPTDWVFASPEMKGKQPLWPDTLWRRYGKPAVTAAKITKRVAFHTFRHTYTTLLTQNNEDVKVVQELLRQRTVGLRSICTRKREWRGSGKHSGRSSSWC